MSKKQKARLKGTTGRKYKKERSKRRSSYDAYKDWYQQYKANWEMKTSLLSETIFERAYKRYQNLGLPNIAKMIAMHSRAGTIEQVKQIIEVLKRDGKTLYTLYVAKYNERSQQVADLQVDLMNMSISNVKLNFSRYWRYIEDLVDLGQMDYEEVFSPKGELI